MTHANTPVDAAALLEHLDWVRRLARGLVADPNAADDVAQEAWLSALRSPPDAGNVRGWFARVVRNAALERARRESRRAEREHAAARSDTSPSGAELVERVATQQHLVQRVLELDEPYRETVLLRYFEELAPEEIAARTNTPVATVKTRLRRALAELRVRLDREHGGDGRAWVLALMPLAQPSASNVGVGALIAMNVKSIVVAAGVLIAALCVLVLVRDPDVAPPTDAARVAEVAELVEPARAADALVANVVDVERVATADTTLRVLVTDMEMVPVAGAEVWTASLDWSEWYDAATDREKLVRSTGVRSVADEHGVSVVPPREGVCFVVARSGSLYGECVFPAEAGEPGLVQLARDVVLRVQVVDERGEPVIGAGVQLYAIQRDERDRADEIQNGEMRTLAPDGIAAFLHFAQRVPQLQRDGAWGAARLHAGLATPVEQRFDPREVPGEPLRLVMPATGRVVVRVEDAEGRALSRGGVSLSPVAVDAARGGNEERRPRIVERFANDRAVFEHVGLGLELEFNAWIDERPSITARQAGPRRAGEEVVVTLRAGEPLPVLTGRLVDPRGGDLGRASLNGRIVIDVGDGRPREESVMTGAEAGRFRIPVRVEAGETARVRLHLRTEAADGTQLSADVAPGVTLRSGENDLGEIVLAPPVIVLSGRLQDSSGKPVYCAVVDFARMKSADDPPESAPYEWIHGQRAMTDHDGRFLSTGVLDRATYAYEVRVDGYVDTGFVEFAPGTTDRTIVLHRCGVVEGTVIATDGVDVSEVAIEARPRVVPADDRAWRFAMTRVLPNGTFRIDGVPPGLVDIDVRAVGDAAPATSILGVEVPEGASTTDPRLSPIDLRALVGRPITLTIEGPDRRAVASAVVAVRAAGDASAPTRRILCEDGRLTLVTRSAAVDVEIRAPGMRVARLEGIAADRTVVLQEGIPITIELPRDLVLPDAPYELVLALPAPSVSADDLRETLWREDGSARSAPYDAWWIGHATVFGPERAAPIRVSEPGTYRPNWSVVSRDLRQSVRQPLRSDDESESFEVRESDAGRTYRLAPNAEDLAAAPARMNR